MTSESETGISREEFLDRFKRRLLDLLGGYVAQTAQTYWEDKALRDDGPEECADSEFNEWLWNE